MEVRARDRIARHAFHLRAHHPWRIGLCFPTAPHADSDQAIQGMRDLGFHRLPHPRISARLCRLQILEGHIAAVFLPRPKLCRAHLCSLLHGSMQIACGLMGLVVSYWWIYPILIQHSGLTDGPCWGIAIAIGNVTHASFRTATLIRSSPRACVTGVVLAIGLWYFADPIGIFCMGFMLGVLLGPIRCVARLSRPPAAATCPRGACEYSEYPL